MIFRRATEADVPAIVGLLADDMLGASREAFGADNYPQYLNAFRVIDADANQFLLVVDDGSGIIGTLQLTFIAGLARGGMKRGLVEAVRVASDLLGGACRKRPRDPGLLSRARRTTPGERGTAPVRQGRARRSSRAKK